MNKPAILGGKPVREDPFPEWPVLEAEDVNEVAKTVKSGLWGIEGEKVAKFEDKFSSYLGGANVVAVSNGTVALIAALRAAGIGPGDEVIIPAYTFVATATAVLEVGAIPIFADINPQTYCLDSSQVRKHITDRTAAVICVHLAGNPADMTKLGKLVDSHDILLIEDAAQAHGAEWKGEKVGTIGDLGTFSFQSSKNLSCGEGGAIVTTDAQLGELSHSYMNCGRIKRGKWYEHHNLGQNFRLGQLQAALLLTQLSRLDQQTNTRTTRANYLTDKLTEIEGIEPLISKEEVTIHSHHLYVLKYKKKFFHGLSKDRFLKALKAEGIPCSPGYSPLYDQPLFNKLEEYFPLDCYDFPDYPSISLAETERACREEAIWLEQRLLLAREEDLNQIVRAIQKIRNHSDALVNTDKDLYGN